MKRDRLAQRRKALGLTQEALAESLGVERTTVARWERGETEPSPSIRPELAEALMVSADRLEDLLTSGAPGGSGEPGTSPDRTRTKPRQLPAAVANFTGRAAELRALTQILDQKGPGTPGTVVISAIGGTAGVGKTALALHWAHQVAHRFADGQLYVNLRGFDPGSVPVTAAEAVRGFLNGLGVPSERIPATPDAQASLYRSLLADMSMLIILDNARDEQQVRPMLPASPASLVLVTSRSQLAGLAAADGARLFSLDVLTHGEAMQLFTASIGAARAAIDPGAVSEIAALCACLPLALAVTAARAATRPDFPLVAFATELRDVPGPLHALDAGDPAASVGAVFSWSYRQLKSDAARMFRLLGLHPGPDISVAAAASLAAVDEPKARHLLRVLARDCLITEHSPGRYALHDLLRAYAADRARECDSQPDRDAAIGRILDHYLHTATRTQVLLGPAWRPLELSAPRPGAAPEHLGDLHQALAWFEAEHQVLLAGVTLAEETGADSHAWQLPYAMTPYLLRRGYPHEHVTIMGTALAAATRLDDALGLAMSHRCLGNACIGSGDYDRARAHLEHCLLLFQRLGDRIGQAFALQNLLVLAVAQARYTDAIGHGGEALRLFRAMGHEPGQAMLLCGVAYCHALAGDYERARALSEQSLGLIGKLGSFHYEYAVWDTLGYAELRLGNCSQAAAHLEIALGLCREYGYRYEQSEILAHVGDARHAIGDLAQARDAWEQALAILNDMHHPHVGEVRAKLAGIGE